MYIIIDKPVRMSREQIFKDFKGKWVFLVGLEGPKYGRFETAIPTVVADKHFDGSETGIYDRLHSEYGENSMNLSLLSLENSVFGFCEVVNENN